jgi:hypothetical protein
MCGLPDAENLRQNKRERKREHEQEVKQEQEHGDEHEDETKAGAATETENRVFSSLLYHLTLLFPNPLNPSK